MAKKEKSIIDQLMALLPENERATVKAKLDANPDLAAANKKSTEVYNVYLGNDEEADDEPVVAPKPAPAPVAVAPNPTAPVASSPAGGNDAILAEIRSLSTSIDGKLDAMRKEFIPASKLPEYEGTILARAIKASDDLSQIRESHRAEFGKPLDREAFEKFVNEQREAGTKFKDLRQAHDMFVSKERNDAEVTRRVDEQVKQKKSGESVPGQTTSIGLSPAQAVLKKARESAKGADGKSNAMVAAERLANLDRARDEAATVN
jgi:hypothetical protein